MTTSLCVLLAKYQVGNELLRLDFFFVVMCKIKTKRPDPSSGDISADEYFCLAHEYIQ